MKGIIHNFQKYAKEFREADEKMKTETVFSSKTKSKWDKFFAYFQIKSLEQQIQSMNSYNRSFIILTGTIIVVSIANLLINNWNKILQFTIKDVVLFISLLLNSIFILIVLLRKK